MQADEKTIQRFWSKVEIQPNGCWHWMAGKTNDGYGAFAWSNKNSKGWKRAHQFAYWAAYGETDKPELHHLCHNAICVNPDHLQPTDRKEHMRNTPGSYGYKWAHRTHCEKGHLLEGDNLLPSISKKGYRRCRECSRLASEQWRKANPEKMRAAVQRWKDANLDRKRAADRERKRRQRAQ